MRQLIQHIRSGESVVADVPAPRGRAGCLRVQLGASLVSAGTERMVVEFAGKSLLDKARSRPDLVRQTLDKVRREGLLSTIEAVQNRLDYPMALGYSAAGTVIEVGEGVHGFQLGDRVAVAGGGTAAHAEIVVVPVNLAVKLPHNVSLESAAFTTLGAIALQGVRLAEARLGEIVAVIGLGLLGQLTVQLLRAAGCRVLGFDLQESRAQLALSSGAEAVAVDADGFATRCAAATNGRGVDAVLITADTKSDEPVTVAAGLARDKGIVVAVGAVGLNLPRKLYYEKELDFRISRSYGPGRYDAAYEEEGRDYPYGYVRWTENRNMQAFVQLVGEGKIDTDVLTTHRLPIDEGARAYALITGKATESFLGVVLTFPQRPEARRTRVDLASAREPRQQQGVTVGLLGAGTFARAVLLPTIEKAGGAELVGVCTGSGVSARAVADRFKFRYCTTDNAEILGDPQINAVVITTRHHLHASQTLAALAAGKHVFVEKPLCLNTDELSAIASAYQSAQATAAAPIVMVGFNRRFAPMAVAFKKFFEPPEEPLLLHYRVNAGRLSLDHWTQDPAQGGGRLIGEGVHFIDFAMWICGAPPESVSAVALPDAGRYNRDNLAVTVTFANGAVAQILYLANGDRAAGKERIEAHGGGRSAILDDFRSLELIKNGRRTVQRSRLRQDKGHAAEWAAFAGAIRTGAASPIAFREIHLVMRTALAALDSIETGQIARVE